MKREEEKNIIENCGNFLKIITTAKEGTYLEE